MFIPGTDPKRQGESLRTREVPKNVAAAWNG